MKEKHKMEIQFFLRDMNSLAIAGRPKEALHLILTRRDYPTWERKYLESFASIVYMALDRGGLK